MRDEFDRKIKEVMNHPPEYPPNYRVWNRIEKLMNGEPEPKFKLGAWWLPILFITALLGILSSGYFYMQDKIKAGKIANLEKLISNHGITTYTSDTLVQNHVTIIHDTIYKETIQYKYRTSQQNNKKIRNEQTYANNSSGLFSYKSHTLPNFKLPSNYSNFLIDKSSVFSTPSRIINTSLPDSKVESNPSGYHYDINSVNDTSVASIPFFEIGSALHGTSTWIPLLGRYQYAPPDKSIGTKLSDLISHTQKYTYRTAKAITSAHPRLYSSSIGIGTLSPIGSLKYENRFYADIGLNFRLNNKFGLSTGLEYVKYSFDQGFDNIKPNELKDFPSISLKNKEDRLYELYGDCSYLNVPIGLIYSPKNYGGIIPYIGLGTSANIPLSIDLAYEVFSKEGHYEIKKKLTLNKRISFNSYWTLLGVRYAWRDDLQLNFETKAQLYFKHINAYEFEDQQYFMAKIGAVFILKNKKHSN